MTPPEVKLWARLRRKQVADLKFRRQHPIGPWILDFFCLSSQLAVEVDGAEHGKLENANRDRRRDTWLNERGIRVLRFSAGQVLNDVEGVLAAIEAAGGIGPGSVKGRQEVS